MNCDMCKRELDNPKEPFSASCGPTCTGCMIFLGRDPDCLRSMREQRLDLTYWLNEHVRYGTAFYSALVEMAGEAELLVNARDCPGFDPELLGPVPDNGIDDE